MIRPRISPLPALGALCAFFTGSAAALPGDVEAGFAPVLGTTGNLIYGTAVQTDGKVLLAGGLTTVGGVARSRAARLNADGSLDTTFDPNLAGAPRSVTALADRWFLLAGEFTSVGGTARRYIARLNPSGALDTTFNPDPNNNIYSVALQPDGRILMGGQFTTVGGTARNYLARLTANGALDTGFNVSPNNFVRTVVVQPDGKIIIGGSFTSIGGTARNLLARLNADGTLDPAFNAGVSGDTVFCAALQADGRILIGGTVTAAGGVARQNIARLEADGTLDASFNPGAGSVVRCLIPQTDGKIVVAGEFTTFGGATRNRLARMHPDGSLDTAFNPNFNETVFSAELQGDGRIIAGGNFTGAGSVTRHALARLLNDPATQTLSVTGAGRVQWLRGGTSPETHQVTFDLSTNGGAAWTALGAGTRIPGGWERGGLSLPASGQIRARARVITGVYNGSSSLLETTVSYAIPPLNLWRQVHFGSMENTGDGANDADPDGDGVVNLLEFAFGMNPRQPDAAGLPAWVPAGDDYQLEFERPASAGGITYIAEQNTSLDPESWTPVPNLGTPPNYFYDVPATAGVRRFLRLRVSVP